MADAYAYGGRAETWVGDHVRLGATGMREKEQSADQTIYGADVRVQSSPQTYVEGEVAHSEGPGFGSSYSIDGGLSQLTPGWCRCHWRSGQWLARGRCGIAG